ncbi:MAG TPA: TetR family transcriptional regulator, partial [Acidimicrobiaceae bacterium]|nr:TetR family transcriptional regulator [Acidimicrobiaceae bacterium]
MSSRKVARLERATVELRETRANLLEAAAKLIRISGIHSLTHAAIAAEAGVARQSV